MKSLMWMKSQEEWKSSGMTGYKCVKIEYD